MSHLQLALTRPMLHAGLAGAQGAGVDPAAVTSLAAAARALYPGATWYDAGSKEDRHPGNGYGSDTDMLEAVSRAEDDARERLQAVRQLQEQVIDVADAAQTALQLASCPVARPDQGRT